ncbi:hypothetical protein ACIBQ1_58405 [Nonomuraea sp. NPDC050153]|uniref:hypothetical protein n=1 Tax=Nonomuraea sp. NPDC050153 TaxID=3364359 RepID=UPI0037ACD049
MRFTVIAALAIVAIAGLTPAAQASTTAVAKPNVRACYDGNCKLTLTKSVSFRVSPKLGLTRLYISFSADGLAVSGTGGSSVESSGSVDGTVTVNGIKIRPLSLSDSRAVLRLSTKKR